MKIQSVAILGAGAVGCYVLWGLADKAAANSLQLGVVAEGSRAERLRQNGCTINGQVYHPQVWTPQQAHGVDLLIVALKYGALPGALDSIRTIVSERTVVMSLMNGVDSEELIAAQVGAAHVLPALIKVASHRTGDGVRFDPETTIGIIYGELTAPFDSDRVQAVLAYHLDNTWTEENPSQSAKYPRATFDNRDNNYATSTLYEQDSKYLRLKTLQVAYNFNLPVMKKLGLNTFQLAFSGYNLWTLTPYLWGDPETRASNAPSYPLSKTYTLSLKLGF